MWLDVPKRFYTRLNLLHNLPDTKYNWTCSMHILPLFHWHWNTLLWQAHLTFYIYRNGCELTITFSHLTSEYPFDCPRYQGKIGPELSLIIVDSVKLVSPQKWNYFVSHYYSVCLDPGALFHCGMPYSVCCVWQLTHMLLGFFSSQLA
jgi:hypothetical protein